MKKRLTLIFAMLMAFMSIGQSVCAINVIMNSSFVKFPDQEPVIENGTTLVPIRTIAESLDLEVSWDDPSDTVKLTKGDFYIELVIGSTVAKTSSGKKNLLTAPKIINSRTMVPLRFIAEELGLTVLWNDKYQRVVINGQIDAEKLVVETKEDATVPEGEEASEAEGVKVEKDEKDEKKPEEVPTEEETEFVEEINLTTISAASASISFEMPAFFLPEETDSEESFAARSLDAFDAQHTYNWEVVSVYESYADDSGTNGICFIVQEFEPYEGEVYDISGINAEYPEAPIAPERPEQPEEVTAFEAEREVAILQQMFTDRGVEFPEDMSGLENNAILEVLGMASVEEFFEQYTISSENVDLTAIEGYDIWMEYQDQRDAYNEERQMYREEYRLWQEECNAIKAVKDYAMRNFSSLATQASDEDWGVFFDSQLNTDEEVRYDGVEVVDHKGKKIVHATIYAEDPDDEQGVYDFYLYIDGDMKVTIFGGTLSGTEASLDAVEALSNMIVD